ncbi:EAL domain-containing protein [Rhizobium sp. RU36D]|uniref:putative bifunctional diguanylate cyclase/phosphodiesterase n=1 Tax=Rhizobium sp. RU36D TaxID=1907415 RepID=UPI0009D7F60F|nr:EAL domain-containing protein [Rhizobium sp. RU36D]SMD18970.1 diguanylate cyclase (GGDEF) domain-containing protein [Rhizobium sp. RU36D]
MTAAKAGHAAKGPSGSAASERASLEIEMAKAVHPIMVRALTPLATYFGGIIIVYFFIETTTGFLIMAPLSGLTAAVLLLAEHRWLAEYRSIRQLEVVGLGVGLLIYANILAFLHVHPEPARLSYFLLLMMCVVTVSPTRRMAVGGAVLSLASMLVKAYFHGPDIFAQFAMLSVACSFVAFGVVLLMREAVERAVKARMAAENLRGQAQEQAEKDALTGLPNRRRFFGELERLIDPATAAPPFHVGIIDLDGFKPVNDLYGHAVGDALLIEVGHRLRHVLAREHMVARLGGDEFSVIVTRPVEANDVHALGQAAIEALRRPFKVGDIDISISGSGGFARFPDNGSSIAEIYERADHALYSAKSHSRGDVVIFGARHEAELDNAGRVEQTLRLSDLNKELFIVFQPQIDAVTGQTAGFEALARWNSARLGPVSPGVFITAAERCGMIDVVTEILMRKTLDAMAQLPPAMRVAINLSARDLVSERTIERICTLVRDSGIEPGRLEFEITETAMMTDFDAARDALSKLSAMGSRIALDDFGSGYSSFGYIHRFPLNKIKIDRSFVTELDGGDIGHNIIRAIVDLCRNLKLDCLVEGVETPEQFAAVQTAGARYVQGYYFSRPLPLPDALSFLERETRPASRAS